VEVELLAVVVAGEAAVLLGAAAVPDVVKVTPYVQEKKGEYIENPHDPTFETHDCST